MHYCPVARFYFHLRNDVSVDDEEGREFPDLAAAHSWAIEMARDMACASIREGHLNPGHYVFATDEQGQEVTRVSFRDTFTMEG